MLSGCGPRAALDWVDGEDWAHAVFELHEFRRTLVFHRVAIESGKGGVDLEFGHRRHERTGWRRQGGGSLVKKREMEPMGKIENNKRSFFKITFTFLIK